MQPLPLPPDTLLSPKRGSRRSSNLQRGPSRVTKQSSKPLSPITPRRAATMRPSAERKARKDAGMIRPLLPQTTVPFMDPLKMHPPTGLKASISAPLQAFGPNAGDETPLAQETKQVPQTVMSPDDIQSKINAMLVATQQLKGKGKPEPDTPTSKKLLSKIFKKFSITGKKELVNNNTKDVPQKRLSAVLGDAPTEAVFARLNESRNLHSPKVQRVVGNKIPRKPVANGGQSILAPVTPNPRHCDEETLRKLTGSIDMDSISCEDWNPFADEGPSFEDDLEYRILKASPDGASTPPFLTNRRYMVDGNGSPKKNPRIQSYKQEGAPMASFFSDDSDSSAGPDDYNSIVEMMVSSPVQSNQHNLAAPESFDGELRVKKHPSPARGWLENLENAMTSIEGLKPEGASNHELDELAQDLGALTSLNQRDSNRLMNTETISRRRADPTSPEVSTDVSSFPKRPSRIPRLSKSPRLNRESRAAKRAFFRPNDARADEIDELF